MFVPELVARQVASTPDAVAVVDGRHELSYAELDIRANRLAHALRGLGVGPGAVVGVCLSRSADLVTSLLAVWKAGAGYLPIDPDQPPRRAASMLRTAGVELVLTDPASAAALVDSDARPVVLPDLLDPLTDRSPDSAVQAPDVVVDPHDIAYVVFTSGSTGEPKGVVVSHAGIANRLRWTIERPGLSAGDRVLLKTTVTFDAHCWEVFAPLMCGATVVTAPVGAERDPAALLRSVAEHRITVLQVVPSVLRLLTEEPGLEQCASLRLLFSAGEPLQAELAARVLRRVGGEGSPDLVIWNTYGPTECSIDVTAHRFDPTRTAGPVPIGRPIDGMRVLVADSGGAPVAVGVPGELYAGGVGVARGYLGNPALTAERFVPDPFAKDGSRLYRTGDQVRWREDGVLEYLGRVDQQVKINGVRIEPGEVENALAAHPGVLSAVVTAFVGADGAKHLAAYVRTETAEVVDELRGFLSDRLPVTHIPAVFIRHNVFALTPNGKVDRSALPAPELAVGPGSEAPANAAEELVAEAWRTLLKIEDVGRHDDFFRRGGNSLQLTRLANLLRTASGRQIKLRGLYSATTVAKQALLLAPELFTPEAADASSAIRPVPRDGSLLPLSFGQRRLWFLDRMNPGSSEWVAAMFLRVPGGTPAQSVQRALDALVERHEALRTRYTVVDLESMQYIDAPAPVELSEVETTREEIAGIVNGLFGRGFDLEHGPLVRAVLARVPGEDPVLTVAMHHITTDGWSSALLEREFHQLLAAYREGRAADLPPLELQYADYAVWQRNELTEKVLEEELRHWTTVLDGYVPLQLPTDRPRAAIRDGRGSVVHFTVPAPVATAFADLGKQYRTTPFASLLTALTTLLARHSGQWDIPVGTPVAGRDRPEIEGVVGFFLNSLVLRCDLDGGMSFVQALERVREVCHDAFAHQNLPFEVLVDSVTPERDLSRTPIYQVAFDLHDESFNDAGSRPEELATLQEVWNLAHTDLTLYLRRQPDGTMAGSLEYATALFEPATAERLVEHFQRLLGAIAADPHLRLDAADLLSAEERHDLLSNWATAPDTPVERTVPELFLAQAARTPDAVAVAADGIEVGYAELDARANRTAHHLRSLGVGPETTVGVLLDRGADLIATLLAVWKAGGAYVPMDPTWPAERVQAMAVDAEAPVVVTSAAYADRFAEGFYGQLVRVDADAALLTARPSTAPDVAPDPDRLAYVIYTSGSTGIPKGVAVPHRGLANHLQWAVDHLVSRGSGGSALFSSVAFDLTMPNLWAPLLAGQRVTVLPHDLDLTELGATLAAQGPFSFLKLTPGHLDILTRQLSPEQAASLAGVLVVAGEALPGTLARQWAGWLGDGRLVNEYGPTETSVGACVHPVAADGTAEVVPIGRPLPNMTMYVLDGAAQPVPTGAVGELYVGGAGVARGYANRPGLTAERFVPDPFGTPGGRLYRTGDLVRWTTGGTVEFLGRTDHQVKIRGYRVEPGEAQAVLATYPGIRDAVVVARVEAPGDVRLAGYFVSVGGRALTSSELAAHCAEHLPDYLVPSSFTELAAVPLNANGKLDRAALPAPDADRNEEYEGPRDIVEERIAAILDELLGTPFGIHDNFFRNGGNSILAIRLIASIQSEFDVALPVRTVFEDPTVAGMAAAVEAQIRAEIDQMPDSELLEEYTR